jgi:hypothetical protein
MSEDGLKIDIEFFLVESLGRGYDRHNDLLTNL